MSMRIRIPPVIKGEDAKRFFENKKANEEKLKIFVEKMKAKLEEENK
ncbi:hypothetical protein ACDN41_11630 [Priestia aryabhattai]